VITLSINMNGALRAKPIWAMAPEADVDEMLPGGNGEGNPIRRGQCLPMPR